MMINHDNIIFIVTDLLRHTTEEFGISQIAVVNNRSGGKSYFPVAIAFEENMLLPLFVLEARHYYEMLYTFDNNKQFILSVNDDPYSVLKKTVRVNSIDFDLNSTVFVLRLIHTILLSLIHGSTISDGMLYIADKMSE